jgi:hypothetical protein
MRRQDTPTRRRRRRLLVALPIATVAALTSVLLPGAGSARATTAPSNTTEPRISGDAIEGRLLTANAGTWSGSTPMSFAYHWLLCPTSGGSPDGSNCQPIGGATSSTYRVRNADVGLRLRVRVIATNSDGSGLAASNPTPVVRGDARPRNAKPPTISGSPVVGQTLTADPGTWSGSQPMSFGYQWRSCNRSGVSCSSIAGATGKTYALRQSNAGTTLRVRVTAKNGVGSTTATSLPTGVIVAGAPTGCPGGSGGVTVDQLSPPARLLVDRFQVSPNPIPLSTGSLLTRFHVTACGGRDVAGALVYVTAVPYNQFAIPPEQQTGGDGWVTLQMNRLDGFPAADRQTLLVMFVRARKAGEQVVGGISSRRLISFHLSR